MNWVRIATGIKNDPSVGHIAEACRVRVAEAVGLVVGICCELGEHARDGNIAHVPDSLLEQWAGWQGKRGQFAKAFRQHLCTDAGVVRSWEKHNGAALREAERGAERVREWRKNRDRTPNATPTETPTDTRDERESVRGTVRRTQPVTNGLRTRERNGTERTTTASADAAAVVRGSGGGEPIGPTSFADLLSRFEDPAHRTAVEGFLRSAAHPVQVAGHLRAALDPEYGGHAPVTVGKALAEMLVNGVPRFHAATFAGYVRRIEAAPPAPVADPHAPQLDPNHHIAVQFAREGDAEWQSYCRERNIAWEGVAA